MLNSLPLLLLLTQINQDDALPSCLFKAHLKITLYALQYKWHCVNHKALQCNLLSCVMSCRLAVGYEYDREFAECICSLSNEVCNSRLDNFTSQKIVLYLQCSEPLKPGGYFMYCTV